MLQRHYRPRFYNNRVNWTIMWSTKHQQPQQLRGEWDPQAVRSSGARIHGEAREVWDASWVWFGVGWVRTRINCCNGNTITVYCNNMKSMNSGRQRHMWWPTCSPPLIPRGSPPQNRICRTASCWKHPILNTVHFKRKHNYPQYLIVYRYW